MNPKTWVTAAIPTENLRKDFDKVADYFKLTPEARKSAWYSAQVNRKYAARLYGQIASTLP